MSSQMLDAGREAIKARLAELTKLHSQSEIARRTGIHRTNVSRYLRGSRVPGEFLAVLADKLAVSPAWLLNGAGPSDAREVTPDAATMGGDLLQLIQAMSNVRHAQLGALTGKYHLRILRELSDAMARYEDLRKRLNNRSTVVMRQLLADLRKVLDKPDPDRAREMCGTAQQLSQFCDDPDLLLEFAVLHARVERLDSKDEAALALARKVVMLTFHHGGLLGAPEFEALVEAITDMKRQRRMAEIRRIATAAMALTPEDMKNSTAALWLRAHIADLDVFTGSLQEGLRQLTSIRTIISGPRAKLVDAFIVRALLFARAIDVTAAATSGEDSTERAQAILSFASFNERENELELALKCWDRVQMSESLRWVRWGAELTLKALRRRSNDLAAEASKFMAQALAGDEGHLFGPIRGARICHLIGKKKVAAHWHKEACRAIARLPESYGLTVMWKARHQRNALELGSKAEQSEAREFFRRHVDLGYRCFAHIVE